jgi:hypothetical protein
MQRFMLPALVLALVGSACVGEVQPADGSPESPATTARGPTETPTLENAEEESTGVTAQPINEACLEACLEGNRRAVALCMKLRSPGARRVCIEAANAVMAVCISKCPDD